jgi:NTP pyrophosphatase (non-canonical NTP hydrolase)
METKDLQDLCVEVCDKLDIKYNVDRDPQLSFTQLMEEVGELAKAVNMPRLRNTELDQDNLNEEFADVLIQLAALAKVHNVDLEDVTKKKIIELKEKHNV